MTRRFHAGTQVRAIMEELGMRYTTPSSMGPDGVLTTSDVYGNEVIAKARGHVGELTGAVNQLLMLMFVPCIRILTKQPTSFPPASQKYA